MKIVTIVCIIIISILLASAYTLWRVLGIYFANDVPEAELDREKVPIGDNELEIKGAKVHYTVSGDEDNPPLVLLQGIGGFFETANSKNELIHSVLSQKFRVYAPEHPNHRRSETLTNVWTYDDYTEYVEEFITKLKIENPVIVGQSFGGKLAQIYAIDHADEIKLLVIGDASTSFEDRTFYEKVFLRLAPIGPKVMESKFVPKRFKHFLVSFVFSIPDEKIDTNSYEKYSNSFRTQNTIGQNYSKGLSKITTPTIIVWGEKDAQFPPEWGKKLNDRLPNAELFIYEDAAHTAMYQYPKKTFDIILDKLGRI